MTIERVQCPHTIQGASAPFSLSFLDLAPLAKGGIVLHLIRKLVRTSAPAMSIEDWAARNADMCQADEIIAASIAASLAKDINDWKATGCFEPEYENRRSWFSSHTLPRLANSSKDLRVEFETRIYRIHPEKLARVARLKGTRVNGIEVSSAAAGVIYDAWQKVTKRVQAAEEAAAKAKADMAKQEAAWNLAEKLLGMKRNEHGALVPVQTVEG
jgi:hypothetical protein